MLLLYCDVYFEFVSHEQANGATGNNLQDINEHELETKRKRHKCIG